MATLPVVFAELARQYPPSKVSDPDFSDSRSQRPIHPRPPRNLRRRRRPRRHRRRHSRRRRPRPRRENFRPKDSLPLRRRTPSAPACTATTANSAMAGPRTSHCCSQTLAGSLQKRCSLGDLAWLPALAHSDDARRRANQSDGIHLATAQRILDARNRCGSLVVGYDCGLGVHLVDASSQPRQLYVGYDRARRPLRHAHVRLFTATLEASARQRQRLLERQILQSESDP